MSENALMEMVEYLLTGLGQDIVAMDKRFKGMFAVTSARCEYKDEVEARKNVTVFRCTNPNLADPQFGWGCDMGSCPYLAGALDWRANNNM